MPKSLTEAMKNALVLERNSNKMDITTNPIRQQPPTAHKDEQRLPQF